MAAFVFAVGVLALEATAAASLRRMRRSAQLTLATSVAKARLEMLAAARCTDMRPGTDTVRSVVSAWTVEPETGAATRVVSQTVSYTLDGAERADSYRAVVQCSP